jgi:hypothetical protein
MTMRVVSKFSELSSTFKDKYVWVVGCGPSVDKVNLDLMREHPIVALNAAVTLFDPPIFRNSFWFYRDLRVVSECLPRIRDRRKFKIITHVRAYHNFADAIQAKHKDIRAFLFNRDAVVHRRTVVEDALQILKAVGAKGAYLLGIDHRVENNEPYAKYFKWKECHFYNPKKPPADGKSVAMESMIKAMRELIPTLAPMQLRTCTIDYAGGLISYLAFESAVRRMDDQRTKSGDGGVRRSVRVR